MNIAVLVKQVPAVSDIQLSGDNNLVRVGAPSMLNPVDLHALEAALALKDQEGGTVTLLTMGTALASDILREGIALGADKGILLSDERMAGSDTLATGQILAAALAKLGPLDLVLAGKRSTDGDTGQIPPALAQRLGMTLLSYADELEVEGGAGHHPPAQSGRRRDSPGCPPSGDLSHGKMRESSDARDQGKNGCQKGRIPCVASGGHRSGPGKSGEGRFCHPGNGTVHTGTPAGGHPDPRVHSGGSGRQLGG